MQFRIAAILFNNKITGYVSGSVIKQEDISLLASVVPANPQFLTEKLIELLIVFSVMRRTAPIAFRTLIWQKTSLE